MKEKLLTVLCLTSIVLSLLIFTFVSSKAGIGTAIFSILIICAIDLIINPDRKKKKRKKELEDILSKEDSFNKK